MSIYRDIMTARQLENSPEWNGDLIYFIGCQENKTVKIGKSSNSALVSRLRKLQVASSGNLRILGIIKGGAIDERELHSRFKKYHIRGEWFSLSDSISGFIDSHTTEIAPIVNIREGGTRRTR